jgi:DNA modification methylase
MFTYNRLLEGDCTQLLKTLPTESVDLVVTDPPYFVRYRDRMGRTIANDADPASVVGAFVDLYRVLKLDTFCISFYGWNRVDAFLRAWRRAGFRPVGHLVWHKGYASHTGYLRARHEQAYLLAKGQPAKPAEPLDDVRPWAYSGNVRHPTEKSVSVLQPLIESFSKRGDLVLDPFAGSGSTLVAAARAGRRYLGIELESRYCELIRERLAPITRPAGNGQQQDGATSSDAALQGLWRWLHERNHHALARTVWEAMANHPS